MKDTHCTGVDRKGGQATLLCFSIFSFTFFFVERYLVILLISLSYCEYVQSSAITNIFLC
jgi:hypothetical protein